MKASGSCRRIERRAPVSSVVRARLSSWGEVVEVGRRALSLRSWRLAVERREAIFCGVGGGADCRYVRMVVSSVVDIMGVAARAYAGGVELGFDVDGLTGCLPTLLWSMPELGLIGTSVRLVCLGNLS